MYQHVLQGILAPSFSFLNYILTFSCASHSTEAQSLQVAPHCKAITLSNNLKYNLKKQLVF